MKPWMLNSPAKMRRRAKKVWWLLTLPISLSKKYIPVAAAVLAGLMIRFGGPKSPIGAVIAGVYSVVFAVPTLFVLYLFNITDPEVIGDLAVLVALAVGGVLTGIIYLWGRRLEHDQKKREA
jgi:hypothetical protein